MFNHEYFEELAALAALGQISEQEFAELRAHLGVCGACRAEQAAFEELLYQELPLADPQLSGAPSRFPVGFAGLLPQRNGYKGRFIAQARQQGVRFSAEVKPHEAEIALARTTDELQRLRQNDSGAASMIAAQQARIRELNDQLATQTEILERERSLLAAGRDIRDLMGARNLHIIDVFDVDGKGKTRKAFGRVFYTENKSLIFYAFDLGSRKFSPAKHSFQAWGYREPSALSAQSLGIFYVDDQKQNRWVLKFNDPNVLAQIDALFVTIEPPGGSKKPSDQKLLYAYLNRKPNHP